jgi:hypothetical protein
MATPGLRMRRHYRDNNRSQKMWLLEPAPVAVVARRSWRTGGFLEQTEECYRAADQTNHIPQAKQPSVALRKICDKQDYPQEQSARIIHAALIG